MLSAILLLAVQSLTLPAGLLTTSNKVLVEAAPAAGEFTTFDPVAEKARIGTILLHNEEENVEYFNLTIEGNETMQSMIEKRAKDLGGTPTPLGGVYPKGVTGYGGNVWECAGPCKYSEPPSYPPLANAS
jgi:hypothetical protein